MIIPYFYLLIYMSSNLEIRHINLYIFEAIKDYITKFSFQVGFIPPATFV